MELDYEEVAYVKEGLISVSFGLPSGLLSRARLSRFVVVRMRLLTEVLLGKVLIVTTTN